jgi:hypothetical protein
LAREGAGERARRVVRWGPFLYHIALIVFALGEESQARLDRRGISSWVSLERDLSLSPGRKPSRPRLSTIFIATTERQN